MLNGPSSPKFTGSAPMGYGVTSSFSERTLLVQAI